MRFSTVIFRWSWSLTILLVAYQPAILWGQSSRGQSISGQSISGQGISGQISLPWQHLASGTRLGVTDHGGRVLYGALDERSSDKWLWLTTSVAGSSVSSLIDVTTIRRIEVLESPDELTVQFMPSPKVKPQAVGVGTTRSIDIAAVPVNIDADAQLDGLDVWVMPRDRDGRLLAKAGSAVIQLKVMGIDVRERATLLHSESWSANLATIDYSPRGGRLRLNFRTTDLGKHKQLYLSGTIDLSLRVPGEGVFKATIQIPLNAPPRVPEQNLLLQSPMQQSPMQQPFLPFGRLGTTSQLLLSPVDNSQHLLLEGLGR